MRTTVVRDDDHRRQPVAVVTPAAVHISDDIFDALRRPTAAAPVAGPRQTDVIVVIGAHVTDAGVELTVSRIPAAVDASRRLEVPLLFEDVSHRRYAYEVAGGTAQR